MTVKKKRGNKQFILPLKAVIGILMIAGVLAILVVFLLPENNLYDYVPKDSLGFVAFNDFSALNSEFSQGYFPQMENMGSVASRAVVFEHNGYIFMLLEGDPYKIEKYFQDQCSTTPSKEDGIVSCNLGGLQGHGAKVDGSHYIIGPLEVSVDRFKVFMESYPSKEHVDLSVVSDVASMPLVVYYKQPGTAELVGYSDEKIMSATNAGSEKDAQVLAEEFKAENVTMNPYITSYTVSLRGVWVVTEIKGNVSGLVSQAG